MVNTLRITTASAALLAAAALSGCSTAHYTVNAALPQVDPTSGYRMQSVVRTPGDEELFIVLTFSGGGTRAAALAFGVLEEMARTNVLWRGQRKRLIDEVDLVYGVSGGSIAAAYWALGGDQALADFGTRFLALDLQSDLLDAMTSIRDAWRLGSSRFGRGELLEEHLDAALFHGATFSDLAKRQEGPFVIITAADLSTGARFDFTQDNFDLLCSDLGSLPLARAVAASSSVPLVFSPITLWNYAGSCGYKPAGLVALATSPATPRHLGESREQQRAREMATYLDRKEKPFVHLVDGGVADNLAARGLLELASVSSDAPSQPGRELRLRKALIITVDAGTESVNAIDKSGDTPAFGDIVRAMADIPIQRFSSETRLLLQAAFDKWRQQIQVSSQGTPELQVYTVEVSFRGLADEPARQTLLRLPTSLYLPAEDIQALRAAASRLMRSSPDFQRLLSEIGEKSEPAPKPAP